MTGVIMGCVAFVYLSMRLPAVDVLKDMHMQVPLRVYTSDHQLMGEFGSKRRIPIQFKDIPPQLTQAVLAVEDARYYEHPGVDFIGLVRAAKAVVLSGHKVQGASTITMQVARNFFLTRKKTYSRKIREILLALKIDRELSKDKVLELYLNKIYFGHRAYGVETAAHVYYGKSTSDLTLPQMAMLAGLPQAPSRNNPIDNPSQALIRRNHVLLRMLEVGDISKATYAQAIKAPVTAKYHYQKIKVKAPYVAEMARQLMVKDFGQAAYDMGLEVTTTISADKQIDAQQALQKGLGEYDRRHGYYLPTQNLGLYDPAQQTQWIDVLQKIKPQLSFSTAAVTAVSDQAVDALLADGTLVHVPWAGLSWARIHISDKKLGFLPKKASDILKQGDVIWLQQKGDVWHLTQVPKVQGALVSVEPDSGAILALVGGYNYQMSNFNRATQARRQPGSSFKPFIYSAALAQGYTLASVINDAPVVVADTGENSLWRPQNDTQKFYGPTRLRVGLTESRNLVSVRLLQDIGLPYALHYVQRFGFSEDQLPHSLSLALGTASVTPMNMAAGFAVFANGGYQVTPYFIQTIHDQNGRVVYQATPRVVRADDESKSEEIEEAKSLTSPMTEDVHAAKQNDSLAAPQEVSPQNAYVMTQAMRDVIQSGTGRAAKVLKRSDLAGKTGTTNDQVDAWFAGFNSDVATIVWVGFDDLQPLHEYASKAALPIWIDYMRDALKGTPLHSMAQPGNIVSARIDPKTGLLARSSQRDAIFEVFRKGYEPVKYAQNDDELVSDSSQSSGSSSDGDDVPLF